MYGFDFLIFTYNVFSFSVTKLALSMSSYEPYRLQLFGRHDYYGLILIDCNAQNQLIYRRLNVISKLIHPGYKCQDEFFCKQWTDFSKIRSILTDVNKRKTYDYYRNYTIKLDINCNSITDWWFPYPKPQVCSINILALINNTMTYVNWFIEIQTPKSNTAKSSTQTKSGFTIKIKKKYISKNKSEKSNQSSQSTKTNATNESRTNNNNNKSSRKRKHHDSNSKINDSPRKKPKLNNGKSKSNTTPSSNTVYIATQLSDSGILSYYFPFHIINL